uniref:Glycine-rich domain-containing protein-like n=1 Tax=Romanomermis culicivorax TaxID=13658 RepID=A0A915KTM4_ROMCU
MVVRNESLSYDQMSSNKVLGGCKTIPKIESIEELNFFNPENIQFSIDLVTEAQKSTDFLHKIEKDYPMLYEDAYAINAIKRYEQYWLPLQAKFHQTSIFTPPLDVHWAWHCHMLAPVQYRIDCEKLIGFVPDHEYASNPNSTDIWNQYCTGREPYDFLISNPNRDTKFVSKFGYDILAAMQRQRSFNYQVCLPHYADGKFLNAAVDRYRKFLHLARVCPGVTLMPSYDIDLIWHCRQ